MNFSTVDSSSNLCWKKISIPKGLPSLLEMLAKEAIRENPKDLVLFFAEFLENQISKQERCHEETDPEPTKVVSESDDDSIRRKVLLKKEEDAASKIQAGFRGYKTRKSLKSDRRGLELPVRTLTPLTQDNPATKLDEDGSINPASEVDSNETSKETDNISDEAIAAEIKPPLETIREESVDRSRKTPEIQTQASQPTGSPSNNMASTELASANDDNNLKGTLEVISENINPEATASTTDVTENREEDEPTSEDPQISNANFVEEDSLLTSPSDVTSKTVDAHEATQEIHETEVETLIESEYDDKHDGKMESTMEQHDPILDVNNTALCPNEVSLQEQTAHPSSNIYGNGLESERPTERGDDSESSMTHFDKSDILSVSEQSSVQADDNVIGSSTKTTSSQETAAEQVSTPNVQLDTPLVVETDESSTLVAVAQPETVSKPLQDFEQQRSESQNENSEIVECPGPAPVTVSDNDKDINSTESSKVDVALESESPPEVSSELKPIMLEHTTDSKTGSLDKGTDDKTEGLPVEETFITGQEGNSKAPITAAAAVECELSSLQTTENTSFANTDSMSSTTVLCAAKLDETANSSQDYSVISDTPTPKPRTVPKEISTEVESLAIDTSVSTSQQHTQQVDVEVETPHPEESVDEVKVVRRQRSTPKRKVAEMDQRSALVVDDEMSLEEMEAHIENEMMSQAATKIQAGFRGYQARKSLRQSGVSSDESSCKKAKVEPDAFEPACEPRPLFDPTNDDTANLNSNAAPSSPKKPPPLASLRSRSFPGDASGQAVEYLEANIIQESDIGPEIQAGLEYDPSYVNNAAVKIQASVRGYLVRRSFKRDKKPALKSEYLKNEENRQKSQDDVVIAMVHPAVRDDDADIIIEKDSSGAATKIQAAYRGYRDRQKIFQTKKAVVTIQATVRGFLTRRRLMKARRRSLQQLRKASLKSLGSGVDVESLKSANDAATKIQAVYRGYQVRSKFHKAPRIDTEPEISKSYV